MGLFLCPLFDNHDIPSYPIGMYDNKEEIINDLCLWLSEGNTLRSFCRIEGMPNYGSIYDWLLSNEDFSQQVARARCIGHDALADECIDIADERPDKDIDGKMDKGFVSWQKSRIHTRTQLLACWSNKYSTKVKVSGDPENPIKVLIDREDSKF